MRTILILLLVAMNAVSNAQVLPVIDSLRRQALQTTDPRARYDIYSDLVDQWAEANFDSAMRYARKASLIAYQLNDPKLIGDALLTLGIPHDYHSHFDSARHYYSLALRQAKTFHDSTGTANATFNLAVLSYFEGDYLNSIDRYKEAEAIYTALHDERHLSRLYNNIGVIYRKTEQFEPAIEAYRQSLAIKEKLKDVKGTLNTLTNLSSLYINSKNYEAGEVNSRRAIALAQEMDDRLAYASELINLGVICQHLNKKKEGIGYLLTADRELGKSDRPRIQADCWINLADFYMTEKDYPSADRYIRKIGSILDRINGEAVVGYYRLQTGYFQAIGNYQKAVAAYQQLADAKENYMNERVKEKTKELEIRFESEKKARLITELQLEQQQASFQLAQSANQRNLVAALASGLLVIVILIFFGYRSKQKSNALLTEKNTLISSALSEREVLLREIHHRVKNNLQIISSLLNLQSKSIDDTAAQSAVAESRNRVKSMALIHEQLYQEDILAGVHMPHYVEELAQTLARSYGVNTDQIMIDIKVEDMTLDVDTAIPIALILNELVSNAFKYAFRGRDSGQLSIELKTGDGILVLLVADDGVGLTDLEAKQSFGLNLVNTLARRLRAEVHTSGPGTRVELRITEFNYARPSMVK